MRGLQRSELLCLAEAVLIQFQIEQAGEMLRRAGRLYAGCQDDHFKALVSDLASRLHIGKDELMRLRVFPDCRYPAVGVINPMLLAGCGKISAVILVESALIHHEDAALHILAQALFRQDGFFGCEHATDGGAVGVLLVARADALQPGNRAGFLLVGGS